MEETISIIENRLKGVDVSITHPSGGVFVWVKLPHGVAAADVHKVSPNVMFRYGSK